MNHSISRIIIFCTIFLLQSTGAFSRYKTSDPLANRSTVNLFNHMAGLAERGCMSGHHDDLAYGAQWHDILGKSDHKDVTGDYPAVFGWDMIELERSRTEDLKSKRLEDIRQYIMLAYSLGGINTLCWHMDNPLTGSSSWDVSSKEVVKSILPGGKNHEMYKSWLDRFAWYISSLKDSDGDPVPIIFRPFHELTGSWFWWGKDLCSPADFIALWRFTHDYLTGEKQVHNLLYAYCTSAEISSEKDFMERYPGDAYVDLLGFDNYQDESLEAEKNFTEKTSACLKIISSVAGKRGKLFAFMEAGYAKMSPDTTWFTKVLHPLLKDTECSYIMFWRNAYDIPDHYFIPYPGHPAADDFKAFIDKKSVFSLKEIGDVYNLSSADPFERKRPEEDVLNLLLSKEILPSGWLRSHIEKDMQGFVGHLDELVPDLITKDDIYVKNRLSRKDKSKNVGTGWEGGDWEAQCLWWNSETQSNWRDGYLRNAFLLRDADMMTKASLYVEHILSSQDQDGYIGIYEPDLRYRFDGENGELWSKATLYRMLLAYYEFTGDKKVLYAVERAVGNVMENYRIYQSEPFKVGVHYGGVTHGLVFTDVLDRLYQLTGERNYRDYALFLYQDYCCHKLIDEDIQYGNIIDPSYRLKGHGVHTYEHLRSLIVAASASGNRLLENALDIYLKRIAGLITPTGAAIGDEDILGRKADPSNIGYEYCSLHELFDSYMRLVQKTGEMQWADKAEKLFYNAALGAKHPEKSAICYLKTDNSYEMTGPRNGKSDPDQKQTRYKYSPVHQDAAVCCSPNAGRITPYYVRDMFMKDKDGIMAVLFGASEVNTIIGGTNVRIAENTDFPFSTSLHFEIETREPVTFSFKIRKPVWAGGIKMNTEYEEENNLIVIRKTWEGKQTISLEFISSVEKQNFNDEVYFSYGPLVLALPFASSETKGREYAPGYTDLKYIPKERTVYEYKGGVPQQKASEMKFELLLFNPSSKKMEKKILVPVSGTILRQVTFKQVSK